VPKDGERVEQRTAFSGFVFRRVERNSSKNSLVAVVINRVFILDIVRYLDEQKHFISGLFNPLYLETSVDMFLQFIVNLESLVVKYPQGPRDGSPAYLRLAFSVRRT
jgi:hypothetical protein